MAPFLWIELNCLKAREQLQGDSLLSANKSPEIPSTHLIVLRMMKGSVNHRNI